VIGSRALNMKEYANVTAESQNIYLDMKLTSDKFHRITLSFTISSSLIREGLAT